MELDFKHFLEALEHFQRNKKTILKRIDKLRKEWEKEDDGDIERRPEKVE